MAKCIELWFNFRMANSFLSRIAKVWMRPRNSSRSKAPTGHERTWCWTPQATKLTSRGTQQLDPNPTRHHPSVSSSLEQAASPDVLPPPEFFCWVLWWNLRLHEKSCFLHLTFDLYRKI